VAQGVAEYARPRPQWSLLTIPAAVPPWTTELPVVHWDGLIVQNSNPAVATWVAQQRIPTVNVSVKHAPTALPTVAVDNRAVGRLVAETGMRLPQIARLCGFPRYEYFSVLFRREFGESPTTYRDRQWQLSAGA
jgi:hypothetical protein